MSTLLYELGERLGEQDTVQVLFGYLALSTVILAVTWPSHSLAANDAWFSLVQVKSLFVAFVSLAYGIGQAREPLAKSGLVLGALAALFVLSLPLEALAWVSSVPPLPFWWAPLVQALALGAFFTLGLVLGQGLARLGMMALGPVVAAMVLVGGFFADLALGVILFNPATAAVHVAPLYLAFCASLLTLYVMIWLYRANKRKRART